MTRVNKKEATKELAAGASKVLEKANKMRESADALVKSLKKMETRFNREEEERAAQKRREEQEKVLSSHSKAFTMLDEDEKAAVEAARAQDEAARKASAAPKADAAPKAEAPKAEKPKADAPKAEAVKPEAKPAAKAEAATKAEQKPAAKAETPAQKKAEAPKQEEKPAAKSAPKVDAATKADAAAKAETKPAVKEEPKEEAPKKPAIGQIIARPGQQIVQKPVGLAPNVIRPPMPARQVPAGAQGGARPQGQYGRPANAQASAPRPQGQYGRPANPQGQYGRPANPQGQYGRPANPQGQYGRPANPQGQYGRPANGQAGAPRPQGQYGRPAGGSQGGFGQNRPQGGFGQGRPQGGMNRGGGMSRSRGPELTPPMEKERVSNYDPNKKNYVRQHDPERVTRNRKQMARDNFNGYDDDVIRGGKRSRIKKPSAQQMMAPIKIENAYMAGDTIVVRDLCEKIGKPSGEIIKKLFMLGNMATINSEIDFDTAQLVCSDFDITLEKKPEQTAEDALVAEDFDDDEENLVARPPVVTIMGHVDHGKTSLLDYIRKSRVTAGEAGGITQHIGAYTVNVDDRSITFLDTPGHEAFTAMRARGTQATDIAVLVVAADDSVMPQTVESINHAKAAGVPIIVAINKMDKPAANPEKVKQDLTQYGVVCEDWGGDTITVPVSALTGQGVDELLEMILLQADMLQLRANPNRLGRGVIIEAKLDKARGPLATVLLQNGTLHVGDNIIAGMAAGRVRALINDRGEKVQEAGPSMPVEIMGFDEVPAAGDELIAVGDDHLSRQVAQERRDKLKASREATMAKMSMENLFSTIEAGKVTTLNLIIKADVQGSVEAVKQAMEKLSNDEVKVRVLHSGAGAITKDDVNLAAAFNAIIIGFNIRPDASARETAEREKVDVRLYTVIYKAIEDMEKAMKGMLEPEYKEVLLGHAEVRNVFKITGAGIIAGCYVTDGKVQRNAQVRLLRDNVVVFEGKLSSLKHLKDDVKEMREGFECGMSLEGHNDIKEGDIVECYVMEEIPR